MQHLQDGLTRADQRLSKRGILDVAQQMEWQSSYDGWQYPITDVTGSHILTYRWKAFDSNAKPKYRWQPNKPDGCDYYTPPQLIQSVRQAQGVLYVAAGEVDVLTYMAAGITNVVSWFGETSIPKTLADDLATWGVHHLIYLPDNDNAGLKSATKLRDTLRDTTVHLDVRQLPQMLGDKADTNDLWQHLNFDAEAFQQAIDDAPPLLLPAPKPRPKREYTGSVAAYDDLDYQQAVDAVFREIAHALDIRHVNGDGWSKPVLCLFHDDTQPSACWNENSGVLHCFACGESYSPMDVADALNIDYPQRPHRQATSTKAKHNNGTGAACCAPTTTLEESIEPFQLATFTADETVNQRYISDIDIATLPREDAILIKSPIGTGKTELIKRMIADYEEREGQPPSVLVITHRQSLARNIAERLDMECYKDIDTEWLRSVPQLVIVYNSLWKLATVANTLPQYDLILIDEIEQFHQHLGGNTFKRGDARRAYSVLRQIIRDSRLVVGLDAHATDTSRDWLTSLTGHCHAIENTYTPSRGGMTLHDTQESVIQTALEIAQTAENPVVIPTNSKRTAKTLETLFQGHFAPSEVMMICSDNSESPDVQDFIRHINTRIADLKVLIYSPSLGTGVDITAPVAAVCGVFQNQPLAAPDLHQMLGRCRNTETTHVYVAMGGKQDETDWHAIYHRHEQNALRTGLECDFNAYGILSVTAIQRSILTLLSKIEAEQNRSRNDLLSHFVALCDGYTLSYRESQNASLREAMKDANEQVKAAQKQAVLSADPVSYEELEQHRRDGTLTPEIRAGHTRYQIEEMVGESITDELYDDLHTASKRAQIRQYADLMDDVEAIKASDRHEAENEYLLTKRTHTMRRRAVLRQLVGDVWGDGGMVSAVENTVSADVIGYRMDNFMTLHLQDLVDVFDWRPDQSRDPVCVLRWMLGKVGLTLDSQQIMRDGERYRVYNINRDKWQTIRAYALQHLEQRQLKREQQTSTITQFVVNESDAGFEQFVDETGFLDDAGD